MRQYTAEVQVFVKAKNDDEAIKKINAGLNKSGLDDFDVYRDSLECEDTDESIDSAVNKLMEGKKE